MKDLRLQETATLFYRILLAYLFYQAARLLFYIFNRNLIKIDGVQDYLVLTYHGTAFDTTAILYVNALFILLSLVPLTVNTKLYYQRFLFWLYFITNGVAYAMNFGDFIYYKFSQARLTMAAMSVAQHEDNLAKVFFVSILEHPFVILSYIVLMTLWVFLYKKVKIQPRNILVKWKYFVSSVVTLCLVATLVVGGIRGDFRHSTRPINMVDANRHVKNPLQANVVLNSVFSFFRTLGSNNFKEVKFVDDDFIQQNIKPYKTYIRKVEEPKPNVVIFILESFGKEYIGAFNRDTKIDGFVSYTPFIDSLAAHSLIAENAYANGRQSIHGMSSILAGIPALKDAFTGSPYSNQKIQSIVSVSNEMGYDTSFFHGAPNGSMGFQGFGNILGFKHYYGKTEYNNDADFDGMWGIWDEPFFQYFANTLAVKKKPFMATMFSVSSHHPFKVPQKYEGKFPKGTLDIHAPIGYTDYALKKFFETAKKMPWFQNTIFVLVADHTNQVGYPEYEKAMNRFAIPILFYSPNERYGLQGVVTQPAQQMDIYPTLADLMGYNKKIRSWGRSLVTPTPEDYLIVNSSGLEQFIIGDYIHLFDGKSFTGLYDKQDLGFEDNLIGKINNAEVKQGQMKAKAWYQDYMDRVINRKLN
ncbi:sulfatase [Chryseobacterium sp. 6424]|uniref:LTA synthase family protein n=1 Tax=Chryseobacterium sp. 6424 TaxID=2039166 RepID=UPI000EFAA4C4|nr:LTA synthase family protein [Chryseobacterium sp. 6424]AYO58066.1 sulfatase [Chryseobacterium sp. 6424]